MPITNFTDAINSYFNDAAKEYDAARTDLANPPRPNGSETADDVKKRSQGRLAAAFSQLSTAETMRSTQQGRDGYAEVVSLMKTTSATAAVLCNTLKDIVTNPNPTTAQHQMITLLTNALQALAQLSPAADWQKPPTSNS